MEQHFFNALGKKLIRFFLQGLLLAVPVVLTGVIIVKAIEWIDGLLPNHYPGLGILIILISLTLLGAIAHTFILAPILSYFDRLLERAPLVKVIYGSIKDLMGAFVGKEKKFNKPVLIKLNSIDKLYRIGFITQEDLTQIGLPQKMVSVYIPHSYNFSGDLFISPTENLTPFNGPAAEVMKFVVSGGVIEMDNIKSAGI